jgi:hypothetical protein
MTIRTPLGMILCACFFDVIGLVKVIPGDVTCNMLNGWKNSHYICYELHGSVGETKIVFFWFSAVGNTKVTKA